MKKYGWLAAGTALAIALIVGIRLYTRPQSTAVTLVTVNTGAVRRTVECNGKVQAAQSEEVVTQFPCIAGEVFVKKGQRVNQGDALFSVDVAATQQVLAQVNGSVSTGITPAVSSTVTAPVSGTVTSLNITQGELTDGTTPCAVITTDDSVRIVAAVREKYVSQIAVGQAVEVSGVAFAKECYHGTVSQLASSAHQQYIGTVAETVVDAVVVIDEDELDSSLRAGLNARATVIVDVDEAALLVPYACVAQDEKGREYVYVYQNNGTAVRQYPTFGRECADGVLVVSGLADGARLVQSPETLSGDTVSVRVE